jgi:alkanesulfonate monooxygenase SsuD/methylene tetrahydromethanopterin reductase-like flavin-dependent oxidoreductase (luciferase family)
VKELLARFEEACQVFTGLLTQERTTFDGKYYQLSNAPLEPQPAKLPILIGASGEKVALVSLRSTPTNGTTGGCPRSPSTRATSSASTVSGSAATPSTVRRSTQPIIEILVPGDTEAEERRDRRMAAGQPTIMGSAEYVLDTVARYPAAGIDEFLVPDGFLGSGSRRFDALERLREEVFNKL